MKITWDTHSRPEPVSVGTWKLESKPLSWFRNWHRLTDEKTEAALSWFQPKEGESRPPTKIPEAYADGLTRDGHHRVHALKILGGDPDRAIPVWVLHPHEAQMQPVQAARSQAPPGGAIVNRQYLPGGRFLPRALLSIRAGILRRKTAGQEAAKAAAGNPRNAVAGEPEKMVAPIIAAVARGALAAAPRVAAGAGRAGAASGGGMGGLLGNAGNLLSMLPMPSPPARREEQPTQMAAQGDPPPMSLTSIIKPKLLVAGTERKTFKPRDVAKIEEAHGIAPEHRLPHSVNPDGTISTRLDDFYAWQDRLAEKRLGREKLHQLVNDPETTDDVKEHHVLQHVTHDARNILRHTSKEEAAKWYGESVRGWEAAMHHLFSREQPGDPNSPHIPSHPQWGTFDSKTGQVTGKKPWMRLAKAVLSYTSGDTTPTKNARAAVRMLKSALKVNPANPFGSLPEKDHDGFDQWKEKAHRALLLPRAFPLDKVSEPGQSRQQRLLDAWNWHDKHGKALEKGKIDKGYSIIKIFTDKRTGQPVGIQPFKSGMPAKPWPGLTQQQIDGMVQRREVGQAEIPNAGENGLLQPKGWGKQSAAIVSGNKLLAKLLATRGEEGTLEFLDGRHSIPDIKKVKPSFNMAAGELTDTHGLGSFIFGPKFGRFYANISGNKDEFTLDKWMARLAYSYMGTVMDAKGNRAEGPRNVGDDRMIRAAFHRAAKHLNLPVADLQAVMWELAQRVPNLFGVQHEQEDFKSGGRQILEDHGLDPGLVEPRGGPPSAGKAPATRGGVPGNVPGRRGNSGRARGTRGAKPVGAGRK